MSKQKSTSAAQDAAPLSAHQRLAIFGSEELSDAQLFGLSLGVHQIAAQSILDTFGGLEKLESKTLKELESIPGVGVATATRFMATLALYRRCHQQNLAWSKPLRSPSDAAQFFRAKLRGKTQECFAIVGLDPRQRMRMFRTIAVGSLSQVDVHPREVFRPLIREGIHSVILAHNHPSGDSDPSEADVELTRRMYDVGKIVGIAVLDHLVVTDQGHCSLAELGLVPT